MATFHFELVSPEKLLFSGNVEDVMVPGTEGDFTVLEGHAPIMSTLRPGIIEIGQSEGVKRRLFVRGGFADMSVFGLTILAEQAIPVEELNADQIAEEIRNAEEDMIDAAEGEAKRIAMEKLDQLRELRSALKM